MSRPAQPPGSYTVRHLRVPKRLDLALRRLVKPERQPKISDLMILFLEDAVVDRLGQHYWRAASPRTPPTMPRAKARRPR